MNQSEKDIFQQEILDYLKLIIELKDEPDFLSKVKDLVSSDTVWQFITTKKPLE